MGRVLNKGYSLLILMNSQCFGKMKLTAKVSGESKVRFFLLLLVLVCLTVNWANILIFNFTVICMEPNLLVNKTSETESFTKQFTSSEKDQAMGIAAAGALLANFPVVTIINWYGPRHLFAAVGLLGALATALVPATLRLGFNWFLVARAFQGIAFAGNMATFGHFQISWTYYKQTTLFTATLCTYVQLAPIFSDPISGLICDSPLGWPSVYYLHALLASIFFLTFFLCYRNHPAEHSLVNDLERQKIATGKDPANEMAQKIVPYKQISTSLAVWAVFIGAMGNYAGINLILQFTPTYLNEVQGFNIRETGLLSALPPLLEAVTKEIAGFVNDKLPESLINETMKTKLFNSIAFCSLAIFLVILSFVPPGHGYLALTLLTLGATLLGFNVGGFYKSGSLISGPYAPFVIGQISTALSIDMLIVPIIVNYFTPNNTREQWAWALYVIALLMVLCNLFYVIFARGDPCAWSISKTKVFLARKSTEERY